MTTLFWNDNVLIGILEIYISVLKRHLFVTAFFLLVLDVLIINKCVPLEFHIGLAYVHEISKYFLDICNIL